MKASRILISVCVFLFDVSVKAGERFEFYNGVRSLGMGGATVAIVNDETALLSNPAALGKLKNYFVTVVDPELDLGAETQSMIEADVMAFMDPQETFDAASDNPGKRFHQRLQLFPSFVVTNFGIGFYGRYSADAFMNEDSTEYTYDYRNDFAVVMGFNFRLFDGRIKFGANARAVNRLESHRDDIPVNATGLDFETDVAGESLGREGFGVGTDVGLIMTAPWAGLPTLAAVYRDAGTTSYDMNNGMFNSTDKRPDRTPGTLDVGIAFFPITGKASRVTFSVEMVDVMDAVEPETEEEADESMRRIHGGLEYNFNDVFFIRGGMNQGYWTAGLEIAIENTQLQIATYGEEVGDVPAAGSTEAYEEIEDRRYVAKMSYRF